jgi:murein L,D-transpeptidase YcbB/YkuD
MTTYITGIIAYPYWNVPESIALNEMLPKMQRDLSYIYNQNLQVLDAKDKEVDPEEIDWQSLSATNFPYRIRQASGCDNSLGLLKFDLANPLAIYLHDTNSRDLFTATSDHWRSHGCVRVQKPVELANLVLGKPVFDPTFMNKCLIDQKPKPLTIPKQIPVFITYNIADVDASGKLRFYKDVYAMNKKAL